MGLFDRFGKKNKTASEEPVRSEFDVDNWFWDSFLLNEAKFRHQQATVKRSSETEPITLGYILQELLNIDLADVGSMTIVSRGEFGQDERTEIITEKQSVLEYQPYKAILRINKKGETVPRTGENTTLVISYRPGDVVYDNHENKNDKSILYSNNSIIIYLRGLGPFMHETAYMRVSVMIPNFSSPDDFRITHSNNQPFTTSFILGYDIVSPESKLKKYDEIEKSLIEKSQKEEELSKDEQTILEGITYSKSLGYDFGYGKWLVSEKRFADALMPLMKVYQHLKTYVITNFEQLHEVFFETCFNIGFCFNEMEQYDRAAYYLDIIQSTDNQKYTIEYINALVNNGDPRSMDIVKHYLHEFNDGTRAIDSAEKAFFYEFLCRRLAYLFIDYKMWDKARDLLEQLKANPACHDFAVQELEYIDHVCSNQ